MLEEVELPVHPVGNVQLYCVAPLTVFALNVSTSELQNVVLPTIPLGAAGPELNCTVYGLEVTCETVAQELEDVNCTVTTSPEYRDGAV